MYSDYLHPTDAQIRRIDDLVGNYMKFADDPDNAEPMFIVNAPGKREFSSREQFNDPVKMLKAGLAGLQRHFDVGDDSVPALRTDFGTGMVASAFGCGIMEMEDSPACVKSHVLEGAGYGDELPNPGLSDGLFKKVEEFGAFFKENIPDYVRMGVPDLQGPFNNAHLIRGNEIFLDFFDNPEFVERLMGRVTDYLVAQTARMNEMFGVGGGYFPDWGAYWKGGVRVCNCSLHMVSVDFYKRFILHHDQRWLDSVGCGRMHYCGTPDNGIFDMFFGMPNMYGIDYDYSHHDLWELAPRTPKHITLLQPLDWPQCERLIAGDWPDKRNLIFTLHPPSVEEGKRMLELLRRSVPRRR
jgi:hypothetical protein